MVTLKTTVENRIMACAIEQLEKEFGQIVSRDVYDNIAFLDFNVSDKAKDFEKKAAKDLSYKRILLDKIEIECKKELGLRPLLSCDFRMMETFNFRISLHYIETP